MKARLCVLGIALCLLVLIACASPSKIVIRYVTLKVYDPVIIGIDKGFYAKRNLEVQNVSDTLAGPTAIQALASGSVEASMGSIPALVNGNAAGLPVIGVSDIQSAMPQQPLEYYYVRADSGIKTVKDVAGKKWAVNLIKSSFHYTALMALEQNNVPEASVTFVLLPFENQTQALLQGQVDIIGLIEPHNGAAKAMYGDKIRLLTDATQIFGSKQFSVHYLNRIWAKDHPVEAKSFVAGTVEAIQWAQSHQDEARIIIAKHTGVKPDQVPDYYFQPKGQVVMSDVQFWIDYLIKRGDVTAKWLKPEDIATNEYNP